MRVAEVAEKPASTGFSPSAASLSSLARRKQTICAHTIRSAFLDWLALPETEAFLDALHANTLAARKSNDVLIGGESIAVSVKGDHRNVTRNHQTSSDHGGGQS